MSKFHVLANVFNNFKSLLRKRQILQMLNEATSAETAQYTKNVLF